LVDFFPDIYHTNYMARRPKNPKLRMKHDLRIPMTEDQKQMIVEATDDEPDGMAAWARGLLLEAARQKLSNREQQPTSRGTHGKTIAQEDRQADR
jgi:hypothetical protein